MRRFFLRLRNAFGRDGGRADLSRELQAHLALLEDEYHRRGMTADEARLAARRALGSTALVGLYAVTGHTVERWRRELGLRVALGAGSGEIRWLVVRRVLAQLGTGLGVGIVAAQLFSRLFADPSDTVTQPGMSDLTALAIMVLSIGAIAMLACVPPIRRATRVDPIVALRTD